MRGKGDSIVYVLSSEISFVQGELCMLLENGCILESTPSLHRQVVLLLTLIQPNIFPLVFCLVYWSKMNQIHSQILSGTEHLLRDANISDLL